MMLDVSAQQIELTLLTKSATMRHSVTLPELSPLPSLQRGRVFYGLLIRVIQKMGSAEWNPQSPHDALHVSLPCVIETLAAIVLGNNMIAFRCAWEKRSRQVSPLKVGLDGKHAIAR
ncbi:hypothetical protein OUZ56_002638 [Daphnia magna]|uniref:Uncharacterized protein n=1 Tax=Daphnia magna TaxID=35525 RepID=A0ABR0A6E2_9CRUS|nr:hypothetical protein OUZ56_002638 [Daphnia magna]